MRIKNFLRFVNENLNPHSVGDEDMDVKSRQGDTIFFDKDEFSDEEWNPTGDLPRKQNPEVEKDSEEEDEFYVDDDEKTSSDVDDETFISDADEATEESDPDFLY